MQRCQKQSKNNLHFQCKSRGKVGRGYDDTDDGDEEEEEESDDDDDEDISEEETIKRRQKAEALKKMLLKADYGSTFTPNHRRNLSTICSTTSMAICGDDDCFTRNHGCDQSLRKINSSGDIESMNWQIESAREMFEEEKKRRAQLLTLNSELAKAITFRSRKVYAKNY